ncbi:syntaxin-19-like [Bombina bombina]|uniref:syntaxin-19-like n=1 Tax=Bombina bombina TaxID=8345 RepID=UPI00235AFE90|nr:syntaxin-19-like [Bombina bombina]
MKDRLEELKQKAKELELAGEKESTSKEDDEPGELKQQAVIFEKEPILEGYLLGIRKIQNELTELSENVTRFGQQQKTLVSTMRRFSVLKSECNITQDIKLQAENISKRLALLSQHVKKAEQETEPSSNLTRILKAHQAALYRHFQNIMVKYNETITLKQFKCRTFIIRQLEVAGKEVSEQEVNKMLEQGKWDVFNENLLTEVKITKVKLSELEQKHKELMNLENQIKELKDLFLHIFLLVEEQGELINNIELATSNTADYIQNSQDHFKLAVKYKRRNPCRTLCCCCFPCFK